MLIRCPYCGSRNVAKILWGYPGFNLVTEQESKGVRIVLGGCRVTGEDPIYECLDCKKRFGKPPVLKNRRKKDQENQVLLPDVITGVEFSVGGFFGGNDVIEIVRKGDQGAICAFHSPSFNLEDPFVLREFSSMEWKQLMGKLFNRYFVHEWNREYYNNDILDGTQWHLIFHLDHRKDYEIYGSNEFPPLFDSLSGMFRRHLSEKVPVEMDSAKRAWYEYMFSQTQYLPGLIREKFERADMDAVMEKVKDRQ